MNEQVLHQCDEEKGAPMIVEVICSVSRLDVGSLLVERHVRHRVSLFAAEGNDHYRYKNRLIIVEGDTVETV